MITKNQPGHTVSYYTQHDQWKGSGSGIPAKQDVRYSASYSVGDATIVYGEGPKYINYRCNWKPCIHTVVNGVHGTPARCAYVYAGSGKNSSYREGSISCNQLFVPTYQFYGNYTSVPSLCPDYSGCWDQIWENIDLNSSDAVLLYSGILQAVPLVGGAFNFVKVFNRAARNLAKSFRKKPFTTVVRSLISADFIDRFVVGPTIDDARKFLDAHNYVVRIMNTMYERNRPLPTALSAASHAVHERHGDVTWTESARNTGFSYNRSYKIESRIESNSTTKVFLLAQLAYETSAVDPIKLWAARTGITRPLDSVWDLIPFSFVIDYFTRAGDFIAGLSDKMSSQDGLRGKVLSIVGAYQTTKSFFGRIAEVTPTAFPAGSDLPGFGYDRDLTQLNQSYAYQAHIERGSYVFQRSPSNPYAYPKEDPSGFFHLDLSSTRIRTLLELIIQAKSKP